VSFTAIVTVPRHITDDILVLCVVTSSSNFNRVYGFPATKIALEEVKGREAALGASWIV